MYLTDEARNKELMIIFMDDLARYDATAAELEKDGVKAERWPEVEKAHLERVANTLEVLAAGTAKSS